MPANFTSGWLGNAQPAWHGLGVVTEGTLPAREAFETANALFTVEKRELQSTQPLVPVNVQSTRNSHRSDSLSTNGLHTDIVRTDTQDLLGIVSKQYEIVPNESSLTHGGVHPRRG